MPPDHEGLNESVNPGEEIQESIPRKYALRESPLTRDPFTGYGAHDPHLVLSGIALRPIPLPVVNRFPATNREGFSWVSGFGPHDTAQEKGVLHGVLNRFRCAPLSLNPKGSLSVLDPKAYPLGHRRRAGAGRW